jgi:nicotinamidase-related amidase
VDPSYGGGAGLCAHLSSRGVIARIVALADTFRRLGLLVVHSTIVVRADGIGTPASSMLLGVLRKRGSVLEGTAGAEIVSPLAPHPTDVVSQRRHGLSPFHGTELEVVLRERGIRTVVVTGVSTDVGIPGACLEALNRGFTAVVPEDGVAGSDPEVHALQVRRILPLLATVTTAAAIQEQLAVAQTSKT